MTRLTDRTRQSGQRCVRGLRRLLAASLTAVVASVALVAAVAQPASADHGSTGTQGIDVSHWQGTIDWNKVANESNVVFAYIKATDGCSWEDPNFNVNYPAAYHAGLIRGAYHFARPGDCSGTFQANFFADNGGAWSADGQTLPGTLDLETNPSGDKCYGLSTTSMRNWILDFYNTYKSRTTRDVVIYTTASWWNTCTGSWTGMASKSPLWIAHWGVHSPTLPAGWSSTTWTFWQWTDCRSVPGIAGCVDGDRFNGSKDRLVYFANN